MSSRTARPKGRPSGGSGRARPAGASCPGVVDWIAPMFTPTGFGDEARGFVKALRALRFPIKAIPVDTVLAFAESVAAEDSAFFTDVVASMDLAPVAPRIGVLHLPATALFRPVTGAAYTIARTMFETDGLHRSSVDNLNTVDEVWVPTRFNLDTFRSAGVTVPIEVVGAGVDTRRFSPRVAPLHVPGCSGTVFLSVFEWSLRKGWDVLLRAWSRAFQPSDDVTLVLRTYPRSRFETSGDAQRIAEEMLARGLYELGLDQARLAPIVVLGSHLAPGDIPRLMAAADCYVAPSRGEGFGRPQLEAMATGLPVIATRWSGNLDFMDDSNSMLVDVDALVTVDDRMDVAHYHGQRWAEPSVEHLADLLSRVAADPSRAHALGVRARADVERRWSWQHVASEAGERLATVARALDGAAQVPAPPEPRVGPGHDTNATLDAPRELASASAPAPDPGPGPGPARPHCPEARALVALAHAAELLEDERLLATYAAAAAHLPGSTLVVYGPGRDPAEFERALRELAQRCEVDLDDGPAVVAILPPGDGAEQREELCAPVEAMLTGREQSGRFAQLPVLRPGVPADFHAVASGSPAGSTARRVSGPLVSVLVPVYNHGEYLEACLDSVLAQSYENLEILLLDDGSTDDAPRVAARFARIDERITLRRNPCNLGLVGNHRRLLELASGEYVKFLHTDDRLRPTAVERLVAAAISSPSTSLAISARAVIDASGAALPAIASTTRLAEADTLFDGSTVAELVLEHGVNFVGEPSTVLFRRDAMLPSEFATYRGRGYTSLLDVSTWMSLLSRGQVAYVAETLSELRLHDEQYGKVLGGVVEHLEWLELVGHAHEAGLLADPARYARSLEGLATRLVHMAFNASGACSAEVAGAVETALGRVASEGGPAAVARRVEAPEPLAV
ncbi:MAG TPA: glycosyltransferase [Acidimicrobiales bacterium]|nr:glycosyltransferase [Acidimicrobiales bacterium]